MSFIDQLQSFFGIGNNLLQAGESALEGAENALQNATQQVGGALNNGSPSQGLFDPGFLRGILDSLRPHHHHHHRPEHEHHHHHHHHHHEHHEGGTLLPLPAPINWQPGKIEPLREGVDQAQQAAEKLEQELQKLGQLPFGSING